MAEISTEELNERVAILRRFRTLLEQQKSKFQEYLNVLEKQQNSISKEDPDALLAHTELEQQIVKNITNLQKVIVPMNKMYMAVNANQVDSAENQEIEKIQNDLSNLQSQVLKQNEINRDLLRVHIESIKTQIKNFKNPYKNVRSVYGDQQKVAQLVEINV